FSSRRRHTISKRDWSSDVCSSDLTHGVVAHGAVGAEDESTVGSITQGRVDLLLARDARSGAQGGDVRSELAGLLLVELRRLGLGLRPGGIHRHPAGGQDRKSGA